MSCKICENRPKPSYVIIKEQNNSVKKECTVLGMGCSRVYKEVFEFLEPPRKLWDSGATDMLMSVRYNWQNSARQRPVPSINHC